MQTTWISREDNRHASGEVKYQCTLLMNVSRYHGLVIRLKRNNTAGMIFRLPPTCVGWSDDWSARTYKSPPFFSFFARRRRAKNEKREGRCLGGALPLADQSFFHRRGVGGEQTKIAMPGTNLVPTKAAAVPNPYRPVPATGDG
jgi:hypothetical protein